MYSDDTTKQKIIQEELKAYNEGKITKYGFHFITDDIMWAMIDKNEIFTSTANMTDEMLNEVVRRGLYEGRDIPLDRKIAESAIIEALNRINVLSPKIYSMDYLLDREDLLTRPVMVAFVAMRPTSVRSLPCKSDEQAVLDICKEASPLFFARLKKDWDESPARRDYIPPVPEYFPIDKDGWDFLIGQAGLYNSSTLVRFFLHGRRDTPKNIREAAIAENLWNIREIDALTAEEIELYLRTSRRKDSHISDTLNQYLVTEYPEETEQALLHEGWAIKYIKKPTPQMAWNAVTCDPKNIRYIKKQTDKLRIHALEQDPETLQYMEKTKKVCAFLQIPHTAQDPQYPAEQYFCRFYEDLADEGHIFVSMLINGKDMPKFMRASYTKSFGNLTDDTEYDVASSVQISPVTKEEAATLKKFGLDKINAGNIIIKGFAPAD